MRSQHEDQKPEAAPEPPSQPALAPPPPTKPGLSLEERVARLEAWIPRLEAIIGAP